MVFLLSQLNCSSDVPQFARRSSLPYHGPSFFPKSWKCQATSSPIPTVVIGAEDHLPFSFQSGSSSLSSTVVPFPHPAAADPSTKINLRATLLAESLVANEQAIVKAAAAEAIALARAAAELANDAVQIVGKKPSLKQCNSEALSKAEVLKLEMLRLIKLEATSETGGSSTSIENLDEEPVIDMENADSTDHEFELMKLQHPECKAVRSGRLTERKARRTRAAEKAASRGISIKSGLSNRKKRTAAQEVDYSDPLHFLRATTVGSRLLTASEELELSAGIQDLLKLEELQLELTKRHGSKPTFSQWAAAAGVEPRSLRRRLNHGILCKDKMIKSNIRLVISIAKKYQGAGMNLQDLVQEGCRGLVRGAEKFDASKGFKFSTYAHWWIKQAVRKFLTDQSRTIRLPFHMVDATYRVREARKQLYSENGKYPDNKQVAEATGLSMKRLKAVMLTPKAPISLDQKIGINQDMKPSEVIADPEAETAHSLVMKQFMKQDLNKVLDSLNPREKNVVRWRFGLDDGRMKTLQEIGELMGVSRERIRQIESSAFRKLKNKKRSGGLQQYLFS